MRRTNNARRGLGIRGQLMFFLCFICLFLLVLFWILSTQLLEPLYTRHIERQLTTQAENVVSQLDDALAEGTILSSWSFGRLYVNTGFFDKLAMDLYSKGALTNSTSPAPFYPHTTQINLRHRMSALYQSFNVCIGQSVCIAAFCACTHYYKYLFHISLMCFID